MHLFNKHIPRIELFSVSAKYTEYAKSHKAVSTAIKLEIAQFSYSEWSEMKN